MKSIKGIYRFFAALLAVLLMLCLSACSSTKENHPPEPVVYDTDRIFEYLRLDCYTNLAIPLTDSNASKSEAVWNDVLNRAEVLAYPEEQVAYYAEQSRATYRYYAEQNQWEYAEALVRFGTSEEIIIEEAKQMVKGDLVYRYIVADAKIALTETEKETLFDRYADRFSQTYGYDRSYVIENMQQLIYDSMLYDKTMEYLVVNNTFVLLENGTQS